MTAAGSRRSRWCRCGVLVLLTALAWSQPGKASAWHGRWRAGFWGFGYRPWCGPVIAPGFYGGWGGGFGVTRFAVTDSVYLGGPFGGFYSGGIRSYVVAPGWCGPAWCGPAWGGCYGWPVAYPYGFGWGWQPVVAPPIVRWIAPVYGPRPAFGFGFADASAGPRPAGFVNPQLAPQAMVARAQAAAPAPRLEIDRPAHPVVVRSSNGLARLQAGKLVAIGDRHLRAAVNEPTKLRAALDAYRRAAAVAPDLPDTFLRQAIVLTSLDRPADAERAIGRAVAIDGRLGSDPAAAVAASEQLPPDPVFGERPDSGPMGLPARSRELLARIFTPRPDDAAPAVAGPHLAHGAPGLNWIADRWTRLHGPADPAARADAVATK